ncbi:MAG: class I SAM-dependent methyltransferase [Acidimicrobiia bacterium]
MGGRELGDRWARWMLHDRFGGSEEARRANLSGLEAIRDRVLDNADIRTGDVLLDVGCGDGLIGFGALDRVGEAGRVIFSDVSQDLLNHCVSRIAALGAGKQCSTVRSAAESLSGIASESVDVVTTRSVLIYVEDKRAAFEAMFRVLRPGGRISLFEPINRRMNLLNSQTLCGLDVGGVEELASKVRGVFEETAPSAMVDFDETDLFLAAQEVGFEQLQVALELKDDRVLFERGGLDWSQIKKTSPNPLAPTIGEAMDQVLAPSEIERLDPHMSERTKEGAHVRAALSFLRAKKPLSETG